MRNQAAYEGLGLMIVMVLGFAPCLRGGAVDPAPPEVTLKAGRIQGQAITVDDVPLRVFKGVPFAASPVGPLRWRAPQPVVPWQGVLSCTQFAAACPQPLALSSGFLFNRQSEDCLYLNVWTAANDAQERRPVMVWIHGGGNLVGAAYAPFYDGSHLAAAGAVVVTIQYRLGAFGYLAHPALTDESARLDGRSASGNFGLMDQIAALRWVRDEIERFGGDPTRVTIFGESAGAANVTYLMASPLTAGLFHRAIAQSGYFGEETPPLKGETARRTGHAVGLKFADRLGVAGEGPEALEQLRALSAEQLLDVPLTIGVTIQPAGDRLRLEPVVDGYVLEEDPRVVWSTGRMHQVPFIAGSNRDDGSVMGSGRVARLAGYRYAMGLVFGPDAPRALELLPAATDAEVPAATQRVLGLLAFRAPARRLVRWIDDAGGQAWLYEFSHVPGWTQAIGAGANHGFEIPFVFGALAGRNTPEEQSVSTAMLRRWVNFASSGNPNQPIGDAEPPAPTWPRYTRSSDAHMAFAERASVGEGLDRAICDLLDRAAERRADR